MPTIKDVAKMAGVSVSTASLALNHSSRVREATRRRIQEAAAELRYRPNGIARDLKLRKTDTIAVLLRDLGGPFYSAFIQGVQDVTESQGFTAIVSRSTGHKQTAVSRLLLENRVDGAIILDPQVDNTLIEAAAGENLPLVVLDRRYELDHVYFVTNDHEGGGYAATRHLLELGHKEVAFLGGPSDSMDSELRLAGYLRAMREAGLESSKRLIFHGGFTEHGGYIGVKSMLARGIIPEALFSANDEMAIGALRAFEEANIRVPDDVSLVGYDDIRLAAYVSPALTTVRQPMYELGVAATNTLFRALQGETAIEPMIFGSELIVRDSTARRA